MLNSDCLQQFARLGLRMRLHCWSLRQSIWVAQSQERVLSFKQSHIVRLPPATKVFLFHCYHTILPVGFQLSRRSWTWFSNAELVFVYWMKMTKLSWTVVKILLLQNWLESISLYWYILKFVFARIVINVGDDFLGCVQTGKVISDVFCLPSSYRREVPPKSIKYLKQAKFYDFTFS